MVVGGGDCYDVVMRDGLDIAEEGEAVGQRAIVGKEENLPGVTTGEDGGQIGVDVGGGKDVAIL